MPEAFIISITTSWASGVGSRNCISSNPRSPVNTTPRMVSSRFVLVGGGEFDRKKWDWQRDFRNRHCERSEDVTTMTLSSLRKQGPITTGLRCCAKAVEQHLSKQPLRRRDERNCAHARGPGSRPGRRKTYTRDLAAHASEVCVIFHPPGSRGRRESRVRAAPAVSRAKCI